MYLPCPALHVQDQGLNRTLPAPHVRDSWDILQARSVVIGNLLYVCLHFLSHIKTGIRWDQIYNGVLQKKYAIAFTLPTKEACCPSKSFLINSLLGCQLQHGRFLKIIDQSTKSSLSTIRVLQICTGNVCQLQGSGNCIIISQKLTEHGFIFPLYPHYHF